MSIREKGRFWKKAHQDFSKKFRSLSPLFILNIDNLHNFLFFNIFIGMIYKFLQFIQV